MKHILLFCSLLLFAIGANSQTTKGLSVPNKTIENEIPGKTYAWIVGISKYQNVPPLSFADSDAVLFKKFLLSGSGGGINSNDMLEMYNEQATGWTLIVKGLTWIATRDYHPGDKLYVYLSGHGDAIDKDDYFFLGSDIETGSPGAKNNYMAGSALQMFNLKNTIKRIIPKGAEVILIIDACRSNEREPNNAPGQYSEGITEAKEGEIMMFSASPGQSAIESKNIGGGHGLFTWYLIGGLSGEADKNKDGNITLFELKNYVEDKVSAEASSKFQGHEQFPFFCCSEKYSKNISKTDSGLNAFWVSRAQKENISNEYVSNNKRFIPADSISPKEQPYYTLFNDAIIMSRLIGDSSASFYYGLFTKKFPKSPLLEDMRITLATECMNYAQNKINIYLRGKDQVPQRVIDTLNRTQYTYKVTSEVPYKEAALMINEAMFLFKSDSGLIKKMQNMYYFLSSNSYFQEDISGQNNKANLDKAIDTIKIAIQQDTSASFLYNTLGNLYKERFEYDSAEMAFNHAIMLSPGWTYSYNNLGRAYHSQKKYEKAETEYKKAIKIDSNYAVAYNSLGNLYDDQAKYTEAEKYYKKALKADSNFSYANDNLNNLNKNKKKNGPVIKNDKSVHYHNEPKNSNAKIATITVGTQTWMATNLNIAYFRNGDKIKEAVTPDEWAECDSLHIGCWCYYDNSSLNGATYGKLYNWYAVNDGRGLAPDGYHIATRKEIYELMNIAGRSASAKKLKSKDNWNVNGEGTNEYKWAGQPAGYRDDDGICKNIGYSGHFWGSDISGSGGFCYYLYYNKDDLQVEYRPFGWGFSVRCLKDQAE